jgi:hypothetical protein
VHDNIINISEAVLSVANGDVRALGTTILVQYSKTRGIRTPFDTGYNVLVSVVHCPCFRAALVLGAWITLKTVI